MTYALRVSGDNQKVSFQIPARAAAISSLCLNLVLVIVVGIILSISDVDFLSTLALALAVIAFIVQIMVFVYQASASTMQLARSEELHGSTMRALTAIEEKSEGTRQTVTTMSDQMLAAMLSKGFSAQDSVQVSDTSLEGGIRDPNVDHPPAEIPATRYQVIQRPVSRTEVPDASERKIAELSLPIGKRREEAAAALKELDTNKLSTLSWISRDYQRYGNADPDRFGHGVDDKTVPREMYDLGLVKRVHASWKPDSTVGVLTDKGKDAAALLLGSSLPADIDAAVLDARDRLRIFEEGLDRRRRERETQLDEIPVED